jgi:hypothetical protein
LSDILGLFHCSSNNICRFSRAHMISFPWTGFIRCCGSKMYECTWFHFDGICGFLRHWFRTWSFMRKFPEMQKALSIQLWKQSSITSGSCRATQLHHDVRESLVQPRGSMGTKPVFFPLACASGHSSLNLSNQFRVQGDYTQWNPHASCNLQQDFPLKINNTYFPCLDSIRKTKSCSYDG